MGHVVFEKEFTDYNVPKYGGADINIFFEIIVLECIPHAAINWFIPNPE